MVRRLVVAAALVALAACTGSPGDDPGGPRVVQPGAPGEPSRELSPEEAAEEAAAVAQALAHTEADVAFMQGMLPHHAQALRMTRLVLPHMEDWRGHVVNLGSWAGREAYAQGGMYVGSKTAVRALTYVLRKELVGDRASPIGVFALRHGWVFAPMSAVSLAVELLAPIALLGGRWRAGWPR
jgi:NAD(P)-dependent dehydrogenase (short-subunit alcohol dehydrogenase family)